MKRYLFFFVWMLFSLCLLTGCNKTNPEPEAVQVVATVFPQYDIACHIAGEYADVKLLLASGQEMHNYEPSPLDVAEISKCDIFLRTGGESEVWTETLLSALDTSRMDVVTLMDCIEVPLAEEEEHHHGEEEHEEETPEFDEHIWNSPVNVIAMIAAVEDALCEADPAHAEIFRQRAETYSAGFAELDAEFRELSVTAENKTLVIADKFPFRYLAAEYGFHYAAAFSGCSSETEPTVKALTDLVEEVKEHNLSTVFYLEFSSGKIADRICAMTGTKSAMLHPCHNVSKEDFHSNVTLLQLMQENYETIKEALT